MGVKFLMFYLEILTMENNSLSNEIAKASAEIKKMNPCTKCGDKGSTQIVRFASVFRIGCGNCDQRHEGFTYAEEAVNFWNLENPK